MRIATAVAAVVLTCAVAARAAGASEWINSQIQIRSEQTHGLIRVTLSYHDPLDQRTLERWSRTARYIKERIWGRNSTIPPDPAEIYFLDSYEFGRVVGGECGRGQCTSSGRYLPYTDAVVLSIANTGQPRDWREEVTHELLHRYLGWLHDRLPQYNNLTLLGYSPPVFQSATEVVNTLNRELGPNPTPQILRPERYEAMKTIINRLLGWPYLDSVEHLPMSIMEVHYSLAQDARGNGEFRVAAQTLIRTLKWFDKHQEERWVNGQNVGTNLFQQAVTYIMSAVDRECAADGAC